MRYTKLLGLLVAAVAAQMSFAAAASATKITGPTGDPTPAIHAVNENGHVVIKNPIAKIECDSTFELSISTHGDGVTAEGNLSSLTFGSPAGTCTNSWHMTPVASGSLEFHYVIPGVATVTSTGMTLSATRFGVTCTYATNNTKIGELVDSNVTKDKGTFEVEANLAVHSGSSPLCGTGPHAWEGDYITTAGLVIHQ